MSTPSDIWAMFIRETWQNGAFQVGDEQFSILERLSFYTEKGRSSRMQTVKRRVEKHLDFLDKQSKIHYGVGGHFSQQWLTQYGIHSHGVAPSHGDLAYLEARRVKGLQELHSIHAVASKGFNEATKSVRNAEGLKNATARIKENQARGHVSQSNRRYSIQAYSDMVIQANHARAFNEATILGGSKGGAKAFRIIDGSQCGLTRHDDPQLANGLILGRNNALKFTLAHPYCRRYFEVLRNEKPPTSLKASIIKAAKAEAAKIVAETALATSVNILKASFSSNFAQLNAFRRSYEMLLRQDPYSIQVLSRLAQTKRELEIKALREGVTAHVTEEAILQDAVSYMEQWAAGEALPMHVRRLLGIQEQIPAKAVGDTLDRFSATMEARARARASVQEITEIIQGTGLNQIAYDYFTKWAQGSVNGVTGGGPFGRISFPKIPLHKDRKDVVAGGKTPVLDTHSLRYALDLTRQFKVSTTFRPNRGWINHLAINPHGLLRASFASDPETGLITPTLRLVPKGPLRIRTRINRSPGKIIRAGLVEDRDIQYMTQGDREALAQWRAERKLVAKYREQGFGVIENINRIKEPFVRVGSGQITSVTGDVKLILPKAHIEKLLGPILSPVQDLLDTGWYDKIGAFASGELKNVVDLFVPHDLKLGRKGVSRITPFSIGTNLGFNFNLNLRKLGITRIQDVRTLTRHQMENAFSKGDLKMVSIWSELVLHGGTVFDLGRIFRMPWEQARYLEEAAKVYIRDTPSLRDIYADLRAKRLRGRFYEVNAEGNFEFKNHPKPGRAFNEKQDSFIYDELDGTWKKASDLITPGGSRSSTFDPVDKEIFHGTDTLDDSLPHIFKSDAEFVSAYMRENYIGLPKITWLDRGTGDLGPGTFADALADPRDSSITIKTPVAKTWKKYSESVKNANDIGFWSGGSANSPSQLMFHEMGHHLYFNLTDPQKRDLVEQMVREILRLNDQMFDRAILHDISDLSNPYWENEVTFWIKNNKYGIGSNLSHVAGNWQWHPETMFPGQIISHYGTENLDEMVAESFLEYISRPTHTVRPLADVVGKFMDKTLGTGSGILPTNPGFEFLINLEDFIPVNEKVENSLSVIKGNISRADAITEMERVIPDLLAGVDAEFGTQHDVGNAAYWMKALLDPVLSKMPRLMDRINFILDADITIYGEDSLVTTIPSFDSSIRTEISLHDKLIDAMDNSILSDSITEDTKRHLIAETFAPGDASIMREISDAMGLALVPSLTDAIFPAMLEDLANSVPGWIRIPVSPGDDLQKIMQDTLNANSGLLIPYSGVVGSQNFYNFVAQAFSNYFTATSPNQVAKIVMEHVITAFNALP